MFLQNRTLIPDDLLKRIIIECSGIIGNRYENTFFKFYMSWLNINGYTIDYKSIPEKCITGRRRSAEIIDLDGGMFVLRIPKTYFVGSDYDDSLIIANNIIKATLHELSHVQDFQDSIEYDDKTFKKNWKNRWWEIKAMRRELYVNIFNEELKQELIDFFRVV